MNTLIYDLETFPNCFTASFMHAVSGYLWVFEISDRRNDVIELVQFLTVLRNSIGGQYRLVGYNNLAFDYPIIHMIMLANGDGITAEVCYFKAQAVIQNQDGFGSAIKPWEVLIPQIDLFKIHHFDNESKRTSLKALQFNMRSTSVEDLPFPVGTVLTFEQMDKLISYNFHDITETLKFYYESLPLIEFREKLTVKYGRNFMNHNDTKIGKDYFIMELEKTSSGSCYDPQTRRPNQTIRSHVKASDVIFPYIHFERPEFANILCWFNQQVLHENERFSNSCIVNNMQFNFGIGGIHGSVYNRTVRADDYYCVLDLDVAGYYPSLSIANNLHPEHLGLTFCQVYQDVVSERRKFAKGTVENAMLKLAGNGVYGDSGNPYSPFYDMQYLLSITINGQLLLCMLAEQILKVPSVELIQVNTDGMTLKVLRDHLPYIRQITDDWQRLTKLTLEEGFYSAMFIRDVNAYIAVDEKGKVKKRKNSYSWVIGSNLGAGELAWHQDHSALVVPKAVEAALVHNVDPAAFIHSHPDIYDFMIRVKVPRNSRLELADGTQLPNTTRYYVSIDGQVMTKVMPPAAGCKLGDFKRKNGMTATAFYSIENEIGGSSVWDERIHTKNKSRYADKRLSVEAGFTVTPANSIHSASFGNIDYNYYIRAAQKLIAEVVDTSVNSG